MALVPNSFNMGSNFSIYFKLLRPVSYEQVKAEIFMETQQNGPLNIKKSLTSGTLNLNSGTMFLCAWMLFEYLALVRYYHERQKLFKNVNMCLSLHRRTNKTSKHFVACVILNTSVSYGRCLTSILVLFSPTRREHCT